MNSPGFSPGEILVEIRVCRNDWIIGYAAIRNLQEGIFPYLAAMPEPVFDPERLYYSISEVANMLGTSQSQIRFWEKEFSMLKPKKNKKGNRQFTPDDIRLLKTIQHLVKDQGYTLQGANEKIKTDHRLEKKRIDVIDTLKNLKGFLQELKDRIPE